jgi:hypothetical protein
MSSFAVGFNLSSPAASRATSSVRLDPFTAATMESEIL